MMDYSIEFWICKGVIKKYFHILVRIQRHLKSSVFLEKRGYTLLNNKGNSSEVLG